MLEIITRGDGLELQACDVCDNLTPVHWLDGDAVCKYCYDAYPEFFQGVVGWPT